MFTIEGVARIAHEINAAYCRSIGDNSQPTWPEAADNIKASAVDGVKFRLANPDAPPGEAHRNWLKFKEADGWRYGEVKDVEAKIHPCIVPFEDLPLEQQVKDHLFCQVVDSLRPFTSF